LEYALTLLKDQHADKFSNVQNFTVIDIRDGPQSSPYTDYGDLFRSHGHTRPPWPGGGEP
jgi:hypothetical protein